MGKIFLKGLLAILPIAITLTLIIWILDGIERIFGWVIIHLVGPSHYFPGLGLMIGLFFVFIVGLAMNAWIVQKIYRWGDQLVKKIPLVKTLYVSLSDLMAFFKTQSKKNESSVVLVTMGGMKVIGLVTRDNLKELNELKSEAGSVVVYVPMSYQLGGYTVIVPRSAIQPIPMSVEKAMRFVVTAGMQIAPPPKDEAILPQDDCKSTSL